MRTADILSVVQEISLAELDRLSPQVEDAVDATPSIDHWCSGPDWQIPVSTAFEPDAERLLLATDSRDGFALLAKYQDHDRRPMFGGMEPLWGFGSPIIGADPQAVASAVAEIMADRDDWQTLFLSGMPLAAGSPAIGEGQIQLDPIVTVGTALALSSLGQVGLSEGITRQIADLSAGYEPWIARRTSRFRRNLRQAVARADAAGLVIEDVSADSGLFDRLMSIEHRSWKGQEGSGMTSVEMSAMYRTMVDRLSSRSRLLAHIARVDGNDVGYILGGVRRRRYRGLQLSFGAEARHLSIGNLLQHHQLRQLNDENLADIYDLGMDFDYKRRWADRSETSLTLVVHRQ